MHRGERKLMFRMFNDRDSSLINVKVELVLLLREDKEGQVCVCTYLSLLWLSATLGR